MKLTNQTILIIGNEITLTSYLIQQLSKLKNRIIVLSNADFVHNKLQPFFPHVTLLHLNIFDEADRLKLIDELNNRYLSPSCIIYNEFSFTREMFNLQDESKIQTIIESFYTSLTHLDECIIPFLETEAEATVAYLLPKNNWFNIKHRHLFYILKRTIIDYVIVLNTIHPHIRFFSLKHPIYYNFNFLNSKSYDEKKMLKLTSRLIQKIENYTFNA